MKISIKYYFEILLGKVLSSQPNVRSYSRSNEIHTVQNRIASVNVHHPTALCKIMKQENSDKGIARHNYTTVYHALLSNMRQKQMVMFEMGIGTNNTSFAFNMGKNGTPGASLRGWQRYFENSRIFGADIDEGALFEEDRIKTYFCDQLDAEAIADMWSKISLQGNKEADIIIDDGLHTFEANVCLFENSIGKLAKGGCYIVEDVTLVDLAKWEQKIQDDYIEKFPDLTFLAIEIPNRPLRDIQDNNVVVVFDAKRFA
ncbi:MAG: hypothetical protein R8N23_11120 [Reichenbachiella sp.]|uniref:hypothetical protein n=1 Tax=Reichenbachiella sp. TaxID=2184521 RepID=UPI00296733A6|nr:hypothetical protein [Reichenbachiella sp.]MDW3210412.1 hypothetical protein [Reichenbachiella sp.]